MGIFEDEPITNLGLLAQSKHGSSTAFLLPDTRDDLNMRNATEVSHKKLNSLTYLEEDTQKPNKANSQVLCPYAIYHPTANEGACTNLSAMLKTITKFDDTDIEGNDSLFLHIAAQYITMMTSSAPFRRYQARNPEGKKRG